MNINDEVLRYLLVKTDARRAKFAARRAASEKEAKEEVKEDSKEEE
jgi:ribosomal protein S6